MLVAYRRDVESGLMRESAELDSGEWIRAETATDEDIDRLASTFNLDASLLRDALDPYETPRFEVEDGVPYLFLRYPYSLDPPGTTPFLIVITAGTLITFARGTPSFLDRIASQPHKESDKILLLTRIIGEIIARYSSGTVAIQRTVNRRRQRVVDMSEKDIIDLSGDESTINMFLDALMPQVTSLSRLASGKVVEVESDKHDLLEDMILSTTQLTELCRSLIRTMVNMRDSYNAIATKRLNHVIRILTALTVIVTIPNVITGIYGMNLSLPLQDNPHAVSIVLFFTLIVVVTITILFQKNKWL